MSIIIPDWQIPENIKTLITTRQGGVSKPPFDSFNLAEHVEDNAYDVQCNRHKLLTCLPAAPFWLNQVHSNRVVDAAGVRSVAGMDADGSYTIEADQVCAVMTADCLPLLICNRQGTAVAAVHAGWRGLLNGIIEQAVNKVLSAVQCQSEDLLVYLGAAIGPEKFEVGEDVRRAFLQRASDKKKSQYCFTAIDSLPSKYLADIYQLARIRLQQQGVENISGGNYCTYTDQNTFFSYRREGKTGRMASLIWLENN